MLDPNTHETGHPSESSALLTTADRPEPTACARSLSEKTDQFMISFLPSMQRKLRRDGLHLFNIWYWDNVLSSIEQLGVLLAGSVREQRQLLNQLKFISNELRMPIVALGTSEALYAMQTDPQIASRLEPFFLAQVARSPEFRTFVVSFGRLLPLEKPTPLADKAIIQKLMGLSSGLTGKVTRPY